MKKVLLFLSLFMLCVTWAFSRDTYTLETKRLSHLGSKKDEVICVQGLDANITERTPRQTFAKVPGVFAYDTSSCLMVSQKETF